MTNTTRLTSTTLAAHPELGKRPLEMMVKNVATLPEDIRTAVHNNGGGNDNHGLFWITLKKKQRCLNSR